MCGGRIGPVSSFSSHVNESLEKLCVGIVEMSFGV